MTGSNERVQQGVPPLYEVQKILGHSTPLMTQRDAHLAPDHLRGAAEALDAALNGTNSAPSQDGAATVSI